MMMIMIMCVTCVNDVMGITMMMMVIILKIMMMMIMMIILRIMMMMHDGDVVKNNCSLL